MNTDSTYNQNVLDDSEEAEKHLALCSRTRAIAMRRLSPQLSFMPCYPRHSVVHLRNGYSVVSDAFSRLNRD